VAGLFLGPLTNLAQGLLEDPGAFRGWRPTVMAGAFAVEGMAAGGADFNSWSDAEALARVLERGVMPRVVPLDITSQVTLTAQAMAQGSAACGTPLSARLNKAMGPTWPSITGLGRGGRLPPARRGGRRQPVAPELYVLRAGAAAGADRRRAPGPLERIEGAPNAELCVAVDAAAVEALLLARLFCAPVLSPGATLLFLPDKREAPDPGPTRERRLRSRIGGPAGSGMTAGVLGAKLKVSLGKSRLFLGAESGDGARTHDERESHPDPDPGARPRPAPHRLGRAQRRGLAHEPRRPRGDRPRREGRVRQRACCTCSRASAR
jgi:hypothetical protein